MEYDKSNNLLLSEESENLSKFVTREYVKVNSLSNTYDKNKSIRFKTPMLRSDLCDYADAYILIKGTITVNDVVNGVENEVIRRNRKIILKNNAPFVSCITRINNEFIEDADDLDIVMPMYNLLEYSKNYRKTISDDNNPNNFPNTNVVNSGDFEYKNKITGNTYEVAAGAAGHDVNRVGKKEIELTIQLRYLGNFWRALNIPLNSCEVSLELKWNKNCIITSLEEVQIDAGPPAVNAAPTDATLAINYCKLYIRAVTLPKDDEIKLLTNLKSGFTREIIWNKYRSQMTTEAINNNLNILIGPTFTNVNRLFVLTYQMLMIDGRFLNFIFQELWLKILMLLLIS